MKRPVLLCLFPPLLGSVAFSLNQAAVAHPSSESSARCESRPMATPRPYLVSSAAWLNGELLMVDPLRREAFRYTAAGTFLGSTPKAFRAALGAFSAGLAVEHIDIKSGGAETLLEGGGHFVLLDSDLLPAQIADFSAQTKADRKTGREVSLGHVYQWKREDSQDLLCVADLHRTASAKEEVGGAWNYGFVSLALNDPTRFVSIWEKPSTSGPGSAKTFYRLGMPLLAGIGDVSYALLFDAGKVQLVRHEAGSSSFDKLPLDAFTRLASALRFSVPRLPQLVYPDDAVAVMRAVESATIPVGLYSQGKYLYVLSRRPGPKPWSLSVIDPDLDRLVGTIDLPSGARHLAAVPGTTWAFIEKGSLEAWQRQTIFGVFTLPSQAIDSLRGCS